MKCPECGSALPASARFCLECGAQIVAGENEPQEAAQTAVPARKLTRAEKNAAKKELKEAQRAAKAEAREQTRQLKEMERAEKTRAKSIREQLKERDRELSSKTEEQRLRRRHARDVYDIIAFDRIFKNGLAEVEEGMFSETQRFDDISYQSAREGAQKDIFQTMAQLLDYFSSDMTIQYTVTNTPLPPERIGSRKFFDAEANGENAELAETFNRILNDKMLEGSSNMVRDHYISYATLAPNADRAAAALARARQTVRQTFSDIGSKTHLLDGHERLSLINSILRPEKPFVFDYDRDINGRSPLTTKDYVCPTSLDFAPGGGDSTCFKSEDMWCQVLVMRENFASELTDRVVASITDLPIPLVLTWHLQPIDKTKSVAMVKRQASWIQKEVIDNQRKALREGYDYSILPPDLGEISDENKTLLDNLVYKSQRLYYFCGLILTYAKTREELDDRVIEIIRTCHAEGIELTTLDLRQREGMNSVLPLAHNHVDIIRDFTTAEATIFMPFSTQELDMPGGGYYGQNQLSGNLVLVNRKELMNPHGFVCGMSGSGKSFFVKREIENTVLSQPNDEIYILDVTGEYSYLVQMNHGAEFCFGPDTQTFCNPFDMADVAELTHQAALAWKIDAVLAMCSALKAEGGQDLSQEERSVITTCVEDVFRDAAKEEATPTLGDFVAALEGFKGVGASDAKRLALIFKRYVSGPLSFLNHQSSFTLGENRLVSFNTKDVPSDMKVFTMLANLESVRQRMLQNWERGASTWLYIDEIQSLYGHPAIIDYLSRNWAEGRKFNLINTGMTPNSLVMASNAKAASIINQSDFVVLLRQSDADRRFWVDAKGLSNVEAGYIDSKALPGYGLLIAGPARVPFGDDFPKGNALYDLFSTTPDEAVEIRQRMKDAKKGAKG